MLPTRIQTTGGPGRNCARTATSSSFVTITDNGPGFDPSIVATVFDRYHRGDRKGEVGIGLSIVRAIVSARGGEVSARNATAAVEAGEAGTPGAIVEMRIPLAPSLAG